MMYENTELTLDIFRHGQATNNGRPDLISGRSEKAHLTVVGVGQSKRLNDRLKQENIAYTQAYTSPINRVRSTAVIALDGIYPLDSLIEVPELEELSQGDWEGKPRNEVYSPHNLVRISGQMPDFAPPGGESLRMVERRFSTWFEDEILYSPKFQQSDSKVAIFSSGQAIRCFLHYVMGFESRFMFRMSTENTSLTRLRFNSSGWFVDKIGDASHLYQPAQISSKKLIKS